MSTASPSPAPAAKIRVLVVDDYGDSARCLSVLLEASGYEARVANDGETAIAEAAAFRPAVVLLDLGLPKMDGYQTAAQLRQQSGGAPMVLIAVTGWGEAEDRARTAAAGFDHHVQKPVSHAGLLQLLRSLHLGPAGR